MENRMAGVGNGANVPEKLDIWNYTDEEEGVSCAFVTNIREASPIVHGHDFFELMLVYEGRGIHFLNGCEVVISEGMLIFIRPQDTHCLRAILGHECKFINLAFPLDTLYKLADYLGEGFDIHGLLEMQDTPVARLGEVEINVLRQKLESFNMLPSALKKYKKMGIRALLAGMLTSHFSAVLPSNSSSMPDWLGELCAAMNTRENLAEGIPAMKKLSGKSHEHLCRVFNKFLGVTPTDFINGLRLNYSANLLNNTDRSILDISMEAGFESLSRFYSLFRKQFGTTPAQFRQQGRQVSPII